jgi:SAM-dependent methyltransferase
MPERFSGIQSSYDTVAEIYAEKFYHELDNKPFDRERLTQFAKRLQGHGYVCDLGCGPGHIARYLHNAGAQAFGVDLSLNMVRGAHKLNAGLSFVQGNMLALPFADNTLAGIAQFYSIIHLPRERVHDALNEMYRVLQPDGLLLLAFHGGEGDIHLDELFEQAVNFDASFFAPDEIREKVGNSGFEIERVEERPPYEFEYPSTRVYILARKSA